MPGRAYRRLCSRTGRPREFPDRYRACALRRLRRRRFAAPVIHQVPPRPFRDRDPRPTHHRKQLSAKMNKTRRPRNVNSNRFVFNKHATSGQILMFPPNAADPPICPERLAPLVVTYLNRGCGFCRLVPTLGINAAAKQSRKSSTNRGRRDTHIQFRLSSLKRQPTTSR